MKGLAHDEMAGKFLHGLMLNTMVTMMIINL